MNTWIYVDDKIVMLKPEDYGKGYYLGCDYAITESKEEAVVSIREQLYSRVLKKREGLKMVVDEYEKFNMDMYETHS